MSRPLKPKKSLGQNFLVDSRVRGRIIVAVSPGPEDTIIEIGPGEGALTELLVERAGRLVAIEIDTRLAEHLRRKIKKESFTLIEADVLETDFDSLLKSYGSAPSELGEDQGKGLRVRVVANLPYYISTPIIEKLILLGNRIHDMTLMLQREVVERIISGPGSKEYGYLSVFVQYYDAASKLFDVPPSAFKPAPKVWSSIVRLTPLERPSIEVDDDERFFAMVRAAFAQRRKTLANNLKAAKQILGIDENIPDIFDRAGIDPGRRAETLSLEEFGILYRALHKE